MYYHKTKKGAGEQRIMERKALLLVSAVLFFLFYTMYGNISRDFADVEKKYKEGTVINLDKKIDVHQLSELLTANNYFTDRKDADFFATELKNKLQTNELLNLGGINKEAFLINPAHADSLGGEEYRKRVQSAYLSSGYTPVIEEKYRSGLPASQINLKQNGPAITVDISDQNKAPTPGVIVVLQQYFTNTESNDADLELIDTTGTELQDTTLHFAVTDSHGRAVFSGLVSNGFYSVLPVKRGFGYGPPKGTSKGPLSKDLRCSFNENAQMLRLLGSATYQAIKEDKVFTVRTPKQVKSYLVSYLALFILSWWLAHLWLLVRSRKADELILPILMALSGICVSVMYAIQDPLNDMVRGNEMIIGSSVGLFILLLFIEINVYSLLNGNFKYFKKWGPVILKNGYIYLIAAFVLTIALFFRGTGPEGSGVKINLNIGIKFQPSEIAKYLVVVFFAAYFSKNAELLRLIPDGWIRFKKSLLIFTGIGLLLFVYLALGDMGPALVLCGTFIILYAVARGDYLQLGIGVASYALLMIIASAWLGGGIFLLAIMTVAWFAGWLITGFLKRTVYESALFLVFVIAAFIFGELFPYLGVAERLAARNDIYANIWNNQTYGGNQVAHGIWSLASGGFTGQGIGEGNSKVMPANHTDMVLTSIGEEIGWIGLVLIILCFAILLHRSLLLARKAAHPFAFYLAGGIAIVTGLQFFIIAAGSLGIMPLTGITLPFLSFGTVSIVVNIAAFGIVLSVSQISGSKRQAVAIQKSYDNTITLGVFSFILASLVLICTLFYYQILAADKYIIKPAYTVNRNGAIIATYNPRIDLLIKKLKAGNIYDRNGLLLATNEKDTVIAHQDEFMNAGVPDSLVSDLKAKRQLRYYPFGKYLFFWLGDYNSRLLWGNGANAKGYFAEYRHMSELRGFKTTSDDVSALELESVKYRENPFLPQGQKIFTFIPYNYSALTPLLKAGINSSDVNDFNLVKKDITLTVDARLQTELQNRMAVTFNNEGFNAGGKKCRASVVIINPINGEVLTSAVYPMPETDDIKLLYDLPLIEQNKAINNITINNKVFTETDLGITFGTAPGSTAKIMSALAGLNKPGADAVNQMYTVTAEERIHEDDHGSEPVGNINMETAVVKSSNVYFIKLINELQLDDQLSAIYLAAGIGIGGKGSYNYYNTYTPEKLKDIKGYWKTQVFNDRRGNYTNEAFKDRPKVRLHSEFSNLAWGQGKMTATPLAMARVAGAVSNQGILQPSKFVLANSIPVQLPAVQPQTICSRTNAGILERFMQKQSEKLSKEKEIGVVLYGKTGSPERVVPVNKRTTDAWYLFFFHSAKMNNHPITVCIRIERRGYSGFAQKLAKEVVIPVLKLFDYIK